MCNNLAQMPSKSKDSQKDIYVNLHDKITKSNPINMDKIKAALTNTLRKFDGRYKREAKAQCNTAHLLQIIKVRTTQKYSPGVLKINLDTNILI